MAGWGITFIIIGIGSYFLPSLGLQFVLVELIGGNGFIFIIVGVVLLGIKFFTSQSNSSNSNSGEYQAHDIRITRVCNTCQSEFKTYSSVCEKCGGTLVPKSQAGYGSKNANNLGEADSQKWVCECGTKIRMGNVCPVCKAERKTEA